MKAWFLLASGVPVLTSAFGQAAPLTCPMLLSPPEMSREIISAQNSASALEVLDPQLKFKTQKSLALPETGAVIQGSVLSPDGSWVAFNEVSNGRTSLVVQDVQTGSVVFRDSFAEIKMMQFLNEGTGIAINARKKSSSDPAQFYLAPLRPAGAGEHQALTSPSELKSLPLQGSQYHGTGVTQVLSRFDLDQIVVIQNSANSVRSYSQYSPELGRNTDVFEANQGATVFDRSTQGSGVPLSYQGRTPTEGLLNPKSSLVAFHLLSPLSIDRSLKESIAIVDLKNSSQILMESFFNQPKLIANSRAYDRVLRMTWSPDGQKLMAYEATTGRLVEMDLVQQKITEVPANLESFSTIEAATYLQDGSKLIFRGDFLTSPRSKQVLRAFLLRPGEPITALNSHLKPLFSHSLRDGQTTGLTSGRPALEMLSGKMWVLVFPNSLLSIEAKAPYGQSITPLNKILDVRKVSDDTLRISDSVEGVFDLTVKN